MPQAKNESARTVAAAIATAAAFALYVAAFEPFGIAEAAYVFAVPAILAARLFAPNCGENAEKRKKNFKRWALIAGTLNTAAWIAILAWMRHVYPPAGWIALFALAGIVSAFTACWFLMLPFCLPKIEENHCARLLKLLGLAGAWVALEWIRSWIFSGFPWALLAHTQWLRPAAIQSAAIGGVWIVSFTLIFFNLAIAEYVYRIYRIQKFKIQNRFARPNISKISPEFYLAVTAVAGGIWLYTLEMPRKANEEHLFRAGLVQPDFAGILKWDKSLARENLDVVKRLTLAAANAGKCDVVLLPEAAIPPSLPVFDKSFGQMWLENLSKAAKVPLIAGAIAFDTETQQYANGVFTFSPESGIAKSRYYKTHLVPFGEYTPFWAKWLGKIVPVGNLERGNGAEVATIEIAGKTYKMCSLICYEDIFPNMALAAARLNPDFIFVCTNDSWYGREGGAWQHAAAAVFQAVSTRKPVLRVSNNGLSCVADAYGRLSPARTIKNTSDAVYNASVKSAPAPAFDIIDALGTPLNPQTLKPLRPKPLTDDNDSIYFRGAGFADVVSYKNFEGKKSPYVRFGNWFVALSFILFAAAFAPSIARHFTLKTKGSNLPHTKIGQKKA